MCPPQNFVAKDLEFDGLVMARPLDAIRIRLQRSLIKSKGLSKVRVKLERTAPKKTVNL